MAKADVRGLMYQKWICRSGLLSSFCVATGSMEIRSCRASSAL